ncbi:hypothetical protein MIR68_003693 [Amoeboaphelidium protococcarum]|nr:hypothetical protein MIR68_003693 [Amoeboaphelidium protococcarum]
MKFFGSVQRGGKRSRKRGVGASLAMLVAVSEFLSVSINSLDTKCIVLRLNVRLTTDSSLYTLTPVETSKASLLQQQHRCGDNGNVGNQPSSTLLLRLIGALKMSFAHNELAWIAFIYAAGLPVKLPERASFSNKATVLQEHRRTRLEGCITGSVNCSRHLQSSMVLTSGSAMQSRQLIPQEYIELKVFAFQKYDQNPYNMYLFQNPSIFLVL